MNEQRKVICHEETGGKRIPLNLIYDYPVKWSKYKVLRDFLQNFYDAIGYHEWISRFSYELNGDSLIFKAAGVDFSYDWLIHIGASTKREETGKYAGYFGEGFKIASLCAMRDFGWCIEIASRNWELTVVTEKLNVDDRYLTSLAYQIWENREIRHDTVLCIYPLTHRDISSLQTVFLSFFYEENILFGKKIWSSSKAAIFLRSEQPKPDNYPSTYDQTGPGIIFSCYQAMGSFKYPLIFCLHDYRLNDRERSGFYMMDVISAIEKTVVLLPPEAAAAVLNVIKDQWNAYPQKKYDFESWHSIVRRLAEIVARSDKHKAAWIQKHPELIVAHRVKKSDIEKFNRRRQALAWIEAAGIRYRLVQDCFSLFGYPVLEDLCSKHDGFCVAQNPTEKEADRIQLLQSLTSILMTDVFGGDALSPCRIIQGDMAAWQGMASCIRLKKSIRTPSGLYIRYRLPYIAIKSHLLTRDKFGEALSTYLHEMAHMFGGDRSSSFSNALTVIMGVISANSVLTSEFQKKWEAIPP